jgi:hypothetical protein
VAGKPRLAEEPLVDVKGLLHTSIHTINGWHVNPYG